VQFQNILSVQLKTEEQEKYINAKPHG